MTPILPPNEAIYVGSPWELTLFYCDPKMKILSSSGGVITAVDEHGLVDGDKVFVAEHMNKSGTESTLNDIGTVANATPTTFENGRSSNGTGDKAGTFGKCKSLVGKTVLSQIRSRAGEGAPQLATIDIDTVDADGQIDISIADTTVLSSSQSQTCVVDVTVDGVLIYRETLKIIGRVIQ